MNIVEPLPTEHDQGLEDSDLYNADLAPVPAARRTWRVWKFRRPVDQHVGLHSYLHARLLAHRPAERRHELVAGHPDDLSRQPDRARADGPQRSRRHALRHPVPGVLPGGVRHARGERPGRPARAGGVRVVRHPDVDRRRRDLQNLRRVLPRDGRQRAAAGAGDHARAGGVFLVLLGNQRVDHLPRDRFHPPAALHQGSATHRPRIVAARLGVPGGGRLRADALPAVGVRPRPAPRGAVSGKPSDRR